METDTIIERLRDLEAQLRDGAYEALRRGAEGDPDGAAEEKRLSKARRAVEKAIRELGGTGEAWMDDV